MLGHAKDDRDVLLAAMRYLDRRAGHFANVTALSLVEHP